jgi:hypothetical protein
MCQGATPSPLLPRIYVSIDVLMCQAQARYVNDTAEKIADIRLCKNAPKIFPDYLRYTTAGVSENEDYQRTT